MKLTKVLTPLIFLKLVTGLCFGQQMPLTVSQRLPYYIDVTSASQNTVYDIQDGNLDIQYLDNVGQSGFLELKLYNWKSELAGVFKLDKTLGLNHYTIELDKQGVDYEVGSIFNCQVVDEIRNTYKWTVRLAGKPKVQGPSAGIFVNPKSVPCHEVEQTNVIEFFGEITQGKTPYIINWYVLNTDRTELLYQPKEEIIDTPDKTSMIIVDKQPSYYVIMQVTDSCGNTDARVVFIDCEDDKKTINTVFVGPLNNWLQDPSQIKIK